MNEEKLYTLEQARKILAKEGCQRSGHDIRCVMRQNNYLGLLVYEAWACDRCGTEFVPRPE